MDKIDALDYVLNNNIEGALVECGVQYGCVEYNWINHLIPKNQIRDIYLFDTFEGLPKPSKYDYTCDNATLFKMNHEEVLKFWQDRRIHDEASDWCHCNINYVKNRLYSTGYPEDRLHFIKGNVLNTLKDISNIPEKIAILRLDTDWYDSSKFELEVLYDKVVEGGVIIFDDYYHWDGQIRATDEFFMERNLNYEIQSLNDGKTGSIIKRI